MSTPFHSLPASRELPLDFGEGGFVPEFVGGGKVNPLILEPEASNIRIKLLPAVRLADACLYASFVSYRLHTPVAFGFNGIDVAASHESGKPPEDDEERARILKRFENVTGMGPLADTQKLAIGGIAAHTRQDYYTKLDARTNANSDSV